jgi:hypothetical protein
LPEQPEKHCYCDLWTRKPEVLREQGLPEGYCGFCSTQINGRPCGKPGHLQSGPGPFTFAHCDEHTPEHFLHFGNLLLAVVLLVVGISVLLWWLL